MPDSVVLAQAPKTLPMLLRAALPAVPGVALLPGVRRTGGDLPTRTLVREGVAIDTGHVAAYAGVCGFPTKDTVPVTYPHMLVFPLHMALMTAGDFPFPTLGTVHLENTITAKRAIGVDESVDVSSHVTNLRAHTKGQAYDMISEVRSGGELVWSETSTFLRRGKGDDDAAAGLELEHVKPSGITWRLGSDLGRRYGSVSGDLNPIHLYGLTAKAFGFNRAIAHGMWSKARCVAALENRLPEAVTIEVAFKTPILLPGSVAFGSHPTEEGFAFSLSNPKSGAPHLNGRTHS
jgi:hypothetical protein